MSDNEINVAIAEELGVVRNGAHSPLPDYCNDLNAMHKAEQRLWAEQHYLRYTFVDELGKMLKQNQWFKIDACDMVDVTARQRAEALLKALGRWKEAAK